MWFMRLIIAAIDLVYVSIAIVSTGPRAVDGHHYYTKLPILCKDCLVGGELLNHTGLRYIQGVSDTGELCQYGYNHAFDDSSAIQPLTAHGRSQALRPRH